MLVCFIYGILFHNQYIISGCILMAQMNRFQPSRSECRPKLLTAGRAPLLLTTRVIPASLITNVEKQKPTTNSKETIAAIGSTFDSEAATAAGSEPALQGVKLLGKLKGGGVLSSEQTVSLGECQKCRIANDLRRGETLCPRCRLNAHFDVLVNEKKLAAAAWERIRRVLCLPKKIKNLSAEQSRAAYHLLNMFVERFSFDEQEKMNADALITALNGLPGLPKLFSKCVREAAARAGESGDGAKRKPISAAKFTEVAARQGSYCYWCGIRVIREAEIPPKNRISKDHSTVVYLSADGELREEAFGTIDHLVRVADGGDNNSANLVISCYCCNQEREIKTLAHNRPFARRRVPCGTCGGRFFHPDWGCCSICGASPKRAKRSLSLFALITEYITGIVRKQRG